MVICRSIDLQGVAVSERRHCLHHSTGGSKLVRRGTPRKSGHLPSELRRGLGVSYRRFSDAATSPSLFECSSASSRSCSAPSCHGEGPAKEERPSAGAGVRRGHRPLQLQRRHRGGNVFQKGENVDTSAAGAVLLSRS